MLPASEVKKEEGLDAFKMCCCVEKGESEQTIAAAFWESLVSPKGNRTLHAACTVLAWVAFCVLSISHWLALTLTFD